MTLIIDILMPDLTGQPWEIRKSKRHQKLFINGKLVGVMPQDGKHREGDLRAIKNLRSQIRRHKIQ